MAGALVLAGACTAETTPPTNPWGNCQPGQPGCGLGNNPDGSDGDNQTPVPTSTPLPCDVQDIMVEHCADCHNPDKEFGAPMAMLSLEDLTANSPITAGEKVYQTMLKRIVDPVKPMPQIPNPRLSTEQIQTLNDWVAAGTPARAPNEVCNSDQQLPTPDGSDNTDGSSGDGDPVDPNDPFHGVEQSGGPEDCEVYYEMRAHGANGEHDRTPYTVPADLSVNEGNQYHCFYFAPPYNAEDVGLWFEPIIDNTKVLHHWLLYGIDASARESGTSSHCSAAQPGAYLLAGWAPGAEATTMPAGIGMQMPLAGSGAGLILELHYFNQTGEPQKDTSGVKFCTAPKAAREKTAAVHFTGGENICIPPGATPDSRQGQVLGMCDMADNSPDIHIINVWPHMHVKGRRMKIDILRANGSREPLHDSAFDFNTQIAYPKNDVIIKAGDRLETTCYYENDENRSIPFGERTQSEMCYGFITAWPAGALVTDPFIVNTSPINAFGQLIQPARRCLDPAGILGSCNNLLDYPGLIAN